MPTWTRHNQALSAHHFPTPESRCMQGMQELRAKPADYGSLVKLLSSAPAVNGSRGYVRAVQPQQSMGEEASEKLCSPSSQREERPLKSCPKVDAPLRPRGLPSRSSTPYQNYVLLHSPATHKCLWCIHAVIPLNSIASFSGDDALLRVSSY
eukprot:1137229-Pelagomonas_calceolata.AAC.3